MAELQDRLQTALGDVYRLEREIGGGGMSRLFLATEASLNRQVVIKLLPPEMASEVSAARFKQEIELAAHLQHPNILPVLTAGARDDLIYYVMPYVAGESLRHLLTVHGRLPVDDARRILTEVSDALAYAHAQGVVHRDIKPENILLEHGHAVLTDFGVARAVAEAQSGERLTQTGMAVGTPGYMSPEQAAGEQHIDARADVYSVAVVGYEMLTGQQPFTGPSVQAVLAAHLTETPRPVKELRNETPPEIDATIARALAKNPRERLQTAAEFRDAVAVTSGSMPTVERQGRRWAVLGGVAVVLAIIAILLWPRGGNVEGDPRKSLIVFPFENRTGNQENDWLQEASMNLLSLSLAQWEDLRVFDDERTASLMRRRNVEGPSDIDFDAARSMARDAKVGTLVMGDIRRESDAITVEAKVHDVPSGDRIMTEIVRTPSEADPRLVFDSLAARILEISGAPAGERPGVVSQTTSSVAAYRAYLRGASQFQRAQFDSAKSSAMDAVHLDTTFALAYILLRQADGFLLGGGSDELRRASVVEAERHSDNLPSRLRSLVQYHVAFQNEELRRARSIVEQLIARDSGDVEAWYQLGEAHWHHSAEAFPHLDSLGNYGRALRAFERTLALDSTYLLAYFHLTQAWGGCANTASRFACFADSAVYGEPDSLRVLIGASELERLRRVAQEQQIAVGYAWVEHVPNAPHARILLADALLERGRYAEAERQAAAFRTLGDPRRAALLEARALYGQRRYREAGERASEAIADLSQAEVGIYQDAGELLLTSGRTSEAFALWRSWLDSPSSTFPVTFPVPTPSGRVVQFPFRVWSRFFATARFEDLSPYTTDSAGASSSARTLVEILDTELADTADFRALVNTDAFDPRLQAYLRTGDTTLLASYVTWLYEGARPDARAHLALARGDSARARALVQQNFDLRNRSPEEWNDGDGERAWSWADLLARLGRLREAVETYAMLDSAQFTRTGGAEVLVRSWAERGALYQELGDRTEAIELYEKFLDALSGGDATVEDAVDRARRAVSALRGQMGDLERR